MIKLKKQLKEEENLYPLWELISRVIITDQFNTRYMDVFLKYPIRAKLTQKQKRG